jgi:DDE family transposase
MARMQASTKAAEAFDRVVEFLESFEPLEGHRQRAKVLYPLDEVLLLVLLGVLAGCEGWVEIEKFGEAELNRLRRFRPYTTSLATFSQRSTPSSSRAASSPGSGS